MMTSHLKSKRDVENAYYWWLAMRYHKKYHAYKPTVELNILVLKLHLENLGE
jgi:hypothetical protein